jgi:acyl-CoA dehydrogenase
MNFELSEQHRAIVDGVAKTCAAFGDEYWTEREETKTYPFEFHRAMADGGWLGITMPEEVGGSNLGVIEAALMMHTVANSSGTYSAASTLHLNLFGPHAIVVHGSPEQKQRWLKPLVSGAQRACFGVTEPDAGLDTTSITTFAAKVAGGYRVNGRKIWTSSAQVADKVLLLVRTTAKAECRRPTEGISLL